METIKITYDQFELILKAASNYYGNRMDELRDDVDNPNRQSGLMGNFHRKSHIDHYLLKINKEAKIEIV